MASSVPPGEGSFPIGSSGKCSVPGNVSGEGPFHLAGSARGKAPVTLEGAVPGKASVALVPGEASVALDGAVRGKCEGAIPCRASVPGYGPGTGSFPCEGSVPSPLEDCFLGQGSGPSDTGEEVAVPAEQGVIRSLDYPILTSFRLRRLLSFLASTCFSRGFKAIHEEAGVFLYLPHLQRSLELCQWMDAQNYIARFMHYDLLGVGGRALMGFLMHLMFMHNIAIRHETASHLIARFRRYRRDPAVIRDGNCAKLVHTVLSMCIQQVRPSIDWNLVGKKAAEVARDVITQAPEFSDFLRLPRRSSNIHKVVNVLPRGFRSRRIHRVKNASRVPGSVIAKYFLPKGRLQPASQGPSFSGLLTDPSAWMNAAIDEALHAGIHTALRPAHPVDCAYNEGRDQKRLFSDCQDFDAGNYPKRPRKTKSWIPCIPTGAKRAA